MRLKIAYALLAIMWSVLLTRVYYLSIRSNEYYERVAEQNSIKTEKIPPIRGQILDRNHNPLAVNDLGFSINLKPHIKDKKIIDAEINAIVELFPDLNATQLHRNYKRLDSPYNQDFVPIVDFVDYEPMIKNYAKLELRENIEVKASAKRLYPYNELASHVIGYIGRANQKDNEDDPLTKLTRYTGRTGIENTYNEELQGTLGERQTRVTALNQVIEVLEQSVPKSKDVMLTLDLELQKYLKEAFGDERAGAVIVMNAKNGEILASASFPEYDLNPFVLGISKTDWNELINHIDHPFTNKLVNALYPPGSVVKMTMGMALFNSGLFTPQSLIMCDPYFELGDRKFRNWTNRISYNMTIVEALKTSCDTYFYRGAYRVGIDRIFPVLERYSFGVKTGVDLPNEYRGVAPNKEWKKRRSKEPWVQGDTINTSIGQGSFLVTPMQIAKNTAIFATGKSVTPHYALKVGNEELVWDINDTMSEIEKKSLEAVRKGMIAVANEQGGTGFRALSTAKIRLAAKTGTAQVVGISQKDIPRIKEEAMEYLKRSHAWITTYGPIEDPQFVVSVLVEHGAHGGSTGGPIAARVYNKLIELGYIDRKYLKESALKQEAYEKYLKEKEQKEAQAAAEKKAQEATKNAAKNLAKNAIKKQSNIAPNEPVATSPNDIIELEE